MRIALNAITTGVLATLLVTVLFADERRPRFSDFPAGKGFQGKVASPKTIRKADKPYRAVIENAMKKGTNFAANYVLVRFQLGDGPIGALVVDAKSGSIFHLPSQAVQGDFFLYETECLAMTKSWRRSPDEEDDDASALSFALGSELLIARHCVVSGNVVTGMERTYLRWHGKHWSLLQREVLPPPPPPPIQ